MAKKEKPHLPRGEYRGRWEMIHKNKKEYDRKQKEDFDDYNEEDDETRDTKHKKPS